MATIADHDAAATAVAVLDDGGLAAWIENELRARGIEPDMDMDADSDSKAEPEPWPQPDPDPGEPEHLLDAEGWPLAIPCADTTGDPDREPETADLLGIAYSGKVNWLAAHPGLAKSWIMLWMVADLIDNGRRVIWADGEDSPRVFAKRLHILGRGDVAASGLVRWVAADDWRFAGPEAQRAAAAWATGGHAFIDAASSTGAGEDAAAFMAWRAAFIDPLTAAGVGVTVADHLPKRRDPDRLASPLGSVQKVATVTGASIELRGAAWTPTKSGTLAAVVRKDREGGVGQVGQTVARITGAPDADTRTIRLEVLPPADAPEHTSAIVDRVWALLERDGPANTQQIIDNLEARAQDVRAALRHLTSRGEVGMRHGPNNAKIYELLDPSTMLPLDPEP